MDRLFENVVNNQFKLRTETMDWEPDEHSTIDPNDRWEKVPQSSKYVAPKGHDETDMSNSSSEKLTFINGENSNCGCEMESKSGDGQYSEAVYIRLCHIHKSK